MWLIILFAAAYTAGSVNFSILLFKIIGKDDPRNKFSRNAGVTNVYRQAGFLPAALVLVLDIGRSMGIALVSLLVLPAEFVPWGGFGLILGNRFPCFHSFKGGKGTANYLGFTAIVSPVSAVVSMPVWCLVYQLFKFPFIASFAMVFILGVGTVITCSGHLIHVTGVFGTVVLIFCSHRPNIHAFLQNRRKIN